MSGRRVGPGDLLDVYADVRTPLLHLRPTRSPRSASAWTGTAPEPAFTAVLAYADGHPVGYAYGDTVEHRDRYWQRTSPTPAEK